MTGFITESSAVSKYQEDNVLWSLRLRLSRGSFQFICLLDCCDNSSIFLRQLVVFDFMPEACMHVFGQYPGVK